MGQRPLRGRGRSHLVSRPGGAETVAAVPTATPLPPNAIGISIVTNDTKADWLRSVTDVFNKSDFRTSAGHDIIVEIIQEASPEPTVAKLVAGELQPTIWSPANISWVELANQQLAAQNKPLLVREECPRVVLAATGFTMWRPMAEALGWPDKPVSWKQILELVADPQGWTKYGTRSGESSSSATPIRENPRRDSTCWLRWRTRHWQRPED